VRSDSFFSVRELTHEISHPLTAASLHLQQMNREFQYLQPKLDEQESQHFQERLSQALLSLEQASSLLQPEIYSSKEIFSPTECVQGIVNILQSVAKNAECSLIFIHQGDSFLQGNSIYLQQIVNNLVYNSIEAYKTSTKENDRQILVSLIKTKRTLRLIVQDFASGIPQEDLPHLFTPDKSSKGKHRGIGLALVKRLVEEEFGGNIEVLSQVGTGTRFVVSFPLWYNTREPKTAPFS
jgi:signal transduction histidine kinase